MKQLIKPLALSALTALAATSAQADIKWNMPTPYADGTHHTQNVRQFAEDVAAATDGEMEIVVHSGASLVKHPEIHRAVRSGQVPIGEIFMGLLGNENPLYKADNIPFLVTSFDGARALWDATRPEVEASLQEQGLQLLYAVPWPPQGFYSQEEITSGADFEGMKMRAYSASTSRMAELLGSVPHHRADAGNPPGVQHRHHRSHGDFADHRRFPARPGTTPTTTWTPAPGFRKTWCL